MTLLDRIQRIVLAGTGTLAEVERQAVLNELARPNGHRCERYDQYEGYYDGQYGAELTGRLKTFLEKHGFKYVENFCEPIVDALALRLELNSVVADNAAYSEWINRVWQVNQMDELQGIVHTQVPMKGDGYLLVDWTADTGLPRFTWNDPKLIRPVYDEHGRMILAAKAWEESRTAITNPNGLPVRRLNLYFEDRIEKWFTTTAFDATVAEQPALWAAHRDLDDTAWPVDWTDDAGEPLGIAVKHFRNKPKGRPFGRSELHSVIPQQNALTKYLVDLAEVLDYQGAAQRWATGVETATFKSAAGTVWTSKSADARFGQFDPVNPAGVLEGIEQMLRRIAARSQTPLHQLMTGGQNPTGETLRAANEPLVKKAEDRQTSYGGVWVSAHVLAMRLQKLYDGAFTVPDDLDLTASWEGAQSVDEKGDLEAAVLKQTLGVSKRTLLSELGYDPDEEAKHREAEAEEAVAKAQKMFEAQGGVTPPGANGKTPPPQPPAPQPAAR